MADVIIPPAYPAPSPHGYIPFILDSKFSSLSILIGDDVLLSMAASIVSSSENPFIFLSKFSIASISDFVIYFGKILFRFANS